MNCKINKDDLRRAKAAGLSQTELAKAKRTSRASVLRAEYRTGLRLDRNPYLDRLREFQREISLWPLEEQVQEYKRIIAEMMGDHIRDAPEWRECGLSKQQAAIASSLIVREGLLITYEALMYAAGSKCKDATMGSLKSSTSRIRKKCSHFFEINAHYNIGYIAIRRPGVVFSWES